MAARGHLVKWLRSTTPLRGSIAGSTIREVPSPIASTQTNALPAAALLTWHRGRVNEAYSAVVEHEHVARLYAFPCPHGLHLGQPRILQIAAAHFGRVVPFRFSRAPWFRFRVARGFEPATLFKLTRGHLVNLKWFRSTTPFLAASLSKLSMYYSLSAAGY